MTSPADIVIVGAGLCGLVAARQLQQDGAQVLLLDKGRSVGGRLATRRMDAAGPASGAIARLDHGAQFFTVRSSEFEALMADWPVHVWHHGPDRADTVNADPSTRRSGGDGHPRYVGDQGMNGIAKHLAQGLRVRTGVHVTRVAPHPEGIQVLTDQGTHLARRVLVSSPVPQTIQMLDGVEVPSAVADLAYQPCVGVLAVYEQVADFSAIQFDDGPVHYLSENASKGIASLGGAGKGIAPSGAVTVHASPDWSAARYDSPDSDVAGDLLDLVGPWLEGRQPVHVQVKRWRYAQPLSPHPDRAIEVATGVVLAGDAFGEAKVEGAARSGLAAARILSC